MNSTVTFPERRANQLLDELCIRDIKDLFLLEEISFARGAIIVDRDLKGMEARLTQVGSRAVIAVSTATTNTQRRRFSITHELGHLEMHRNTSSLSLCKNSDINEGNNVENTITREQEANVFASAFLLPQRFFAPMCKDEDPSLNFVSHLATTFGTSLTATGLRYVQFCDEPVAIVFSQNGHIRWFKGSKEFDELNLFISVGSHLDPETLAYQQIQTQPTSIRQRRVPISAWVESGKYKNIKIIEQSCPMPSQQAVLTLLWIDDDISQDTYYDWE